MREISIDTYYDEKHNLNMRENIVYEHFKVQGNMTAKEAKVRLGFLDGNMIKPRITDLCNKDLMESKGKRKDKVSPFKKVHVWGVKNGN